jgi:ribosome-binding factor A
MKSHRIERVEELLKRELSEILQHGLKDPRIGFITVSRVKVSADLRHAKVFVSVMGKPEVRERSMEGLVSACGYVQRELGSRVKMKFLPHLEFVLDNSLNHGFHIMEILKKIDSEKKDDRRERKGNDSPVGKEE